MIFNKIKLFPTSVFSWLYHRFLQLIIYPSIWVAAALASLGRYSQIVLNLGDNWQPIALIFVTALIPYNLDRIFDSYVQEIPDNQAQLFFRKPYVWFLLIVAIISTFIILYNAPLKIRYLSIAGIIPLLYGAPLFPWREQKSLKWYRLKDIRGSKAWIVGTVLTYAVIALPIGYSPIKFDFEAALTTLFMFVFIVTNSHIFDVRDLDSDREKGVKTLPTIAGVKGTKIILAALNLFVLLTLMIAYLVNQISLYPEMILALSVNLIYVWQIDLNTPRWVYNILIESFLFIPLVGFYVRKIVFE